MNSTRVLAAALTADLATGFRYGLTARAGCSFERKTIEPPVSAMPTDVYRPAGAPRMAMLLLHGLATDGKDDARLRSLAEGIARSGILVVVPEVASFRRQKVRATDVDAARDALRTALAVAGADLPFAAGGISYAAGPLFVAASKEEFRRRVGRLVAFGGFWDMRDVFVFALTGRHEFLGERYQGEPIAFVREVATEFVLDRFEGEGREKLEVLARADRETARKAAEDRSLSEKARWFAWALAEEEPLRVLDHIRKIDNALILDMWKVSPASVAPEIPGRVILAHSVADPMIPFTQSQKLHYALRARVPAELTLLRRLGHEDRAPSMTGAPRKGGGAISVCRFMRRVLQPLPPAEKGA